MNQNPEQPAGINIFEQIDAICKNFRRVSRTGQRPRIEDWLVRLQGDAQSTLFSNLLEIEIRLREKSGEQPNSNDYLKRFPQFAGKIRQAFDESTMGSLDDLASGTPDHSSGDHPTHTFESPAANRLGDYELVRELGRGGFGVVYEARHIKRNNRVALKTLPTGVDGQELNAERLHRFRKEFRSLSEINHPNLVGMQTLEVDGSQWFFTMDLIEGVDFLSYVRPMDQLDEDRLRSALKQLASGIIFLHEQKIVHRDLKPSNVLVDESGRVLILDFGLVAQLQTNADMTVSRSGMFAGTPRYAAPEQMFGERSEASDWYAFGTMLYEALTGRSPFAGKLMELLRQKQNEDPPSLVEQEQTEVTEDLAKLADGLLKREPGRRLTTRQIVESLQLDLETHTYGSTAGSHGSSESVDDEALDPESALKEEIVLIGREKQLAQLKEAKQELLEKREPIAIWITGKSGEGKSSLAEIFLQPIRRGTEMLVLSGRCYDRESVPFKVVDSQIDSLVRYLCSRPSSVLETLLPDDIQMLAHLFPLLRRVKPIKARCQSSLKGIDDKQIRYRGFAAMKDLLVNIGKTVPIVMFIDDLQWGDADSAEAMANLLAPPHPPPVLFLGSYRSDETDESPFLNDWPKQLEVSDANIESMEVTVEPLSELDCVQFLVNRFGAATDIRTVATELFNNTKGNPYFLEQLIDGYNPETGELVPIPLERIIDNRLRKCPENAQALFDVIAVAGKALPIEIAAEAAGLSNEAWATVTHMRSERLVRLIGTGVEQMVDTYHDKIRENAVSRLGSNKRKLLHSKFAAMLQKKLQTQPDSERQDNGIVFDIANHYFEADCDDAFEWLVKAGQLALKAYAMEVALENFRKAESKKPDSIEKQLSIQHCLNGARALAGCGFNEEAIEEYNRAISLSDDQLEKANCYLDLCSIYFRLGNYPVGKDRFARGLEVLGQKMPKTSLGKLVASLWKAFQIHFFPKWFLFRYRRYSQEHVETIVSFRQVGLITLGQLDIMDFTYFCIDVGLLSRVLVDDRSRLDALMYYSGSLAIMGVPVVPRRLVSYANKTIGFKSDPTGIASFYLGVYQFANGDVDKATATLSDAAEKLCRSRRYEERMAYHFGWHCCSVSGDVNNLIELATKEIGEADRDKDRLYQGYSRYGLAEGWARKGHLDSATNLMLMAFRMVEQTGSPFVTIAKIQYAKVALQNSDFETGKRISGDAINDFLLMRFNELTAAALPLYVESVLENNWATESKQISRKLKRRAGWAAWSARVLGWSMRNLSPHAYRASGRLASANGKKGKALKYFALAIKSAEKIGARYELARTLIDRSMLEYDGAKQDRIRGLSLLEELHCVLPVVEQKDLGITQAPYPIEEIELGGSMKEIGDAYNIKTTTIQKTLN